MTNIQVLLVGGRQAPNVIGAMLLRPERVVLLVSRDARNQVSDVLDSLRGIETLSPPDEDEIIEVGAYDYDESVVACKTICEKYQDHIVQFNLTGSTKIMAFAAYDVARQCKKAEAFYVNTTKGEFVWLVGSRSNLVEPFHLDVKTYLSIYGREAKRTFDFAKLSFTKEQAIRASRLLAGAAPQSAKLLHAIRKKQGSGRRAIVYSKPNEQEQELITQLVASNVIDVTPPNNLIIRSNEDWNFFKGDWLEIYVWDEARRQKDNNGQPLFDECEMSLEIPAGNAVKEIDVACLYQAQMIHCSCKTDKKPFNTLYLDELRSVSSLIGGRFCSRVFITNGVFHNEEQQKKFLAQAKQREIVVVTGDSLKDVGNILASQAIRPDFRRI